MQTAVLLSYLSKIQHSYAHDTTQIQTWQRKWGGSTKVTWDILNSHTVNLKITTHGKWFAGLSRGRIAIGNIFWLRTHLRGRECNINYFLHVVLLYFLTKEEYFSAWTFYYIIYCWQGLVFCTLIFSTGKKLLRAQSWYYLVLIGTKVFLRWGIKNLFLLLSRGGQWCK